MSIMKNDLIKISISDNYEVDYSLSKGMYRVSLFEKGHYVDEIWFDAYEDKEIKGKEIAIPVKPVNRLLQLASWIGICPRCGETVTNSICDLDTSNRTQYCCRCGQLVEFKEE